MLDLEKPYHDAEKISQFFREKYSEKKMEIWEELQDECWAEREFVYPYIPDTSEILSKIISVIAKFKSSGVHDMKCFDELFKIIDIEVESASEFQVNNIFY